MPINETKINQLANDLRSVKSRSKRKLLDDAADMIEELWFTMKKQQDDRINDDIYEEFGDF